MEHFTWTKNVRHSIAHNQPPDRWVGGVISTITNPSTASATTPRWHPVVSNTKLGCRSLSFGKWSGVIWIGATKWPERTQRVVKIFTSQYSLWYLDSQYKYYLFPNHVALFYSLTLNYLVSSVMTNRHLFIYNKIKLMH